MRGRMMICFMNNLSYFVGTWVMVMFCFQYALEKNWENCICWGMCIVMLWATWIYKKKADSIDQINTSLIARYFALEHVIKSNGGSVQGLNAEELMNVLNKTDKTEKMDGKGREQ